MELSEERIKKIIKEVRSFYDTMFQKYEGVGKLTSDKEFRNIVLTYDKFYKQELFPVVKNPVFSHPEFLNGEAYNFMLMAKCLTTAIDICGFKKAQQVVADCEKEKHIEGGSLCH